MTSWIALLMTITGCSVVEDLNDGTDYSVECRYVQTCFPNEEVIQDFTENKCLSNDAADRDFHDWWDSCQAETRRINEGEPKRCTVSICDRQCRQVETLPCL